MEEIKSSFIPIDNIINSYNKPLYLYTEYAYDSENLTILSTFDVEIFEIFFKESDVIKYLKERLNEIILSNRYVRDLLGKMIYHMNLIKNGDSKEKTYPDGISEMNLNDDLMRIYCENKYEDYTHIEKHIKNGKIESECSLEELLMICSFLPKNYKVHVIKKNIN